MSKIIDLFRKDGVEELCYERLFDCPVFFDENDKLNAVKTSRAIKASKKIGATLKSLYDRGFIKEKWQVLALFLKALFDAGAISESEYNQYFRDFFITRRPMLVDMGKISEFFEANPVLKEMILEEIAVA